MKIDILSIFPAMFSGVTGNSIIKKAIENERVAVEVTDFREYAEGKHHIVDDYPYGGGAGMLLKAQPIFDAVAAVKENQPETKPRVILMDPAGKRFDQKMAEAFAEEEHLIFICGHYEGYDERIREHLVTDEVSIGDYILTGGEIGAMIVMDSVIRLLPGVLGNKDSAVTDSFSTGLLEHPHYTRPADFRGMKVPDILLSGNHAWIEEWRDKESLKRTYERRPDLLKNYPLTDKQKSWLKEWSKSK
ncbi:tRNA (guanosine(37)-N1)-methyltransferase TrmD [Listeria ivanovii]|uniref:tRNA (guanine-N(1)-)-methyltransferase n=2 Tax=Listeria ivanovii TaxID=1638 RepID=A0ABS1G8Z6_LISIV|nr:tRNA (guanosine(37)-N1)-methyltransferase TrmD [Listeria ivanovii]EFR96552.1 tRNA (guanine-N1)-methyltransferase [Listeria ivanovii FSL F6-596]AIS60195.1 tRNA (guanine-N1)-methyltransferase [Listeria ivanovii subsp. londoniensis]MBC2255178.1 tRNA (guanosine(37)-N1)-methyltransferase TrmD [Listeria ivanovii]MBK1963336.1 tRNA (guanosine(37)-N1)-methyltransferase TrmD [Listeria ivanovii subsp. londoniensis]MBM5608424.1 tRNA (guanosine(37)-N1)-methyltransferase TrmD [Listeria ivanovii]